jgi:hypothetical protein
VDPRLLGELTVMYRGVPMGRLEVIEVIPDPPAIDPLLPREIRPQVDLTPRVLTRNFTPLPAFDAMIAPVVERMRTAYESWHNAVALPRESRSRALDDAAWSELNAAQEASEVSGDDWELHDEEGTLVPAFITVGLHRVWADLDDAAVGVMARLRLRRANGKGDSEPPAT